MESYSKTHSKHISDDNSKIDDKKRRIILDNFLQNRTGASPGTFFTVSGTARMVPAEDLKVLILVVSNALILRIIT